jgi:putative ATP-binding cassette transporter
MPQLTDAARKRSFLGKLWALSAPYFLSVEAPIAIALLAAVLAIVLGIVFVNYLLNGFYGEFQNMLQARDLTPTPVTFFGVHLFTLNKFLYLIGYFTIIAIPAVALSVYSTYLQQMLQIRWRRWMTERFLGLWLENRAYYGLQIYDTGTENPEQRIEEDINAFTDTTLDIIVGIVRQTVTLFTFVGLLWVLSEPLAVDILGTQLSIPGMMVWIALLYAGLGTYISYRIGRRLVPINYEQQKLRASFRFEMSRLKENSEAVALYRGEADEQRGLLDRFGLIWTNWWMMMRAQKRLGWFTQFYGQAGGIFPILVIAPAYFAKLIDFGAIARILDSFNQVSNALTWFMDSFLVLAEWKATVNRLIGFVEAVEHVKAQQSDITLGEQPGRLETQELALALPDGQILVEGLSAKIVAGDRVLISGDSGSGKTTLFRALAGLWPFGKGRIAVPANDRTLFLPQRPYLPNGTLRHAIRYPGGDSPIGDDAVREVLDAVNLSRLKERLDERVNWSMKLSIGEQQRLAIARALLLKPDWLYLDEATSALDRKNEQRMYELISERLPNATILSIAHRPEVAKYHHRRLNIDPETRSATLAPIAAE